MMMNEGRILRWVHRLRTATRRQRLLHDEVLNTYWTIVGPTRWPIRCALYRTNAGLELRTYRGAHHLLYYLRVLTEDQGARQAAAWRRAMLTVAGFADANANATVDSLV